MPCFPCSPILSDRVFAQFSTACVTTFSSLFFLLSSALRKVSSPRCRSPGFSTSKVFPVKCSPLLLKKFSAALASLSLALAFPASGSFRVASFAAPRSGVRRVYSFFLSRQPFFTLFFFSLPQKLPFPLKLSPDIKGVVAIQIF